MNKKAMCLLLCVLIIAVTGCTEKNVKVISLKKTQINEENLQFDNKTIKIAIASVISPKKTYIYYEDLMDYISKKLGMPIKIVQRDSYKETNDLLEKGEVEIGFVCSGAYIAGHDEFGMELLVAPKMYNESVYYSYIIVHKDSKIQNFEDLRGKTFAFTDPLSNTGKLYPTYRLAIHNETPDSYFGNYIFTRSHDNSIELVAWNIVDGAAVDSLIWEYANEIDPEFTSKTRIIEKSPPFGIPPVVVNSNIDPKLKNTIKQILLAMDENKEGKKILSKLKIDEFVVVNDSSYDFIRNMKWFIEKNKRN
ncbi:MAG: phosphate/phosphite/phosphonate ABC transporter substrate-binding protein [Methanosarcinales archaeon]